MLTMIRTPAVAGSFYARETEQLKKQIENCFKNKLGPGMPRPTKNKEVIAGVSPHAGYVYSGPVASHLYKKIAESKQAETYVILGPNHTGMGTGVSIYARGTWATPLGQVKVNEALAKKILEECEVIEADESAHIYEHSIEVQIPFLQFVQKTFQIVPICMLMQDIDTARGIGEALAKIYKTEKFSIIASSDFTHFEIHKFAAEKDAEAIKAIEALDTEKFYGILTGRNLSICGFGPIMVAMTFAKEIGMKKGTLLKYATSGDVTGDLGSVVGYASILFE